MSTMNIQIYGREYAISCDDGQEAYLGQLVQVVNDRLKTLSHQMGRGPENLMLVYTALMLADELGDAQQEAARLREQVYALNNGQELPSESERLQEMERAMADSMHQIAGRLELMATQMELETA